jgi:hypothetical protein
LIDSAKGFVNEYMYIDSDINDPYNASYFEHMFTDPKLAANLQQIEVRREELRNRLRGNLVNAEMARLEQQMQELGEERSAALDALRQDARARLAKVAEGGDSNILSTDEMINYILSVDKNKDGIIANDESRDPV